MFLFFIYISVIYLYFLQIKKIKYQSKRTNGNIVIEIKYIKSNIEVKIAPRALRMLRVGTHFIFTTQNHVFLYVKKVTN